MNNRLLGSREWWNETPARSAVLWKWSQIISFLLVVVLSCAAQAALSQQTHVLSSDERALVTRIDLSQGEAYVLQEDQEGTVWVAVDPLTVTTAENGQQRIKHVAAGSQATLLPHQKLGFRSEGRQTGCLILVKPKKMEQDLTVSPFILSGSLEDASARNATLLIAISNSHFQDTRNLGDESEWKPGRPNIITMRSGSVRWIRSGIHHFKNLGPNASKLVSIEW